MVDVTISYASFTNSLTLGLSGIKMEGPTSISSTNSTLRNLAVAFNIPALMFLFEHDHFSLAQSIEFELLGEGLSTPKYQTPKNSDLKLSTERKCTEGLSTSKCTRIQSG